LGCDSGGVDWHNSDWKKIIYHSLSQIFTLQSM
jgi:hypothetical protein